MLQLSHQLPEQSYLFLPSQSNCCTHYGACEYRGYLALSFLQETFRQKGFMNARLSSTSMFPAIHMIRSSFLSCRRGTTITIAFVPIYHTTIFGGMEVLSNLYQAVTIKTRASCKKAARSKKPSQLFRRLVKHVHSFRAIIMADVNLGNTQAITRGHATLQAVA